jgi:hypothetical protein
MRALTLVAVALCGLVFSGCYDHKAEASAHIEPAAQAGDGPLLDRVSGEQGPVVFDHAGHMGYGFACTDCHHTVAPGGFPSEGCIGCHVPPADDDPAHGGPDDNTVLVGATQDTAELSGVPFNHYTHASSQGYKLACDSCHHLGGNLPCDTCHGEVAKQQGDDVVPKLKRAMHLQCQGCHDALVGNNPDSIAPVDCDSCHSGRELERLDGALSFERAAHLSCVTCHRDSHADRPGAPQSCTGCHVADAQTAPVPEPEPDLDEAVPCETEDCVAPEVEEGAEDAEAPAEDAEAPVEAPAEAPVEAPAEAPVEAPAEAPVEAPADPPAEAPAAAGPADVVWPGSMGVVTFRHGTHGTMGCDGCHPGMAPMTSAKMGMEKGHAACASCHPQVTGDCAKCHVQ